MPSSGTASRRHFQQSPEHDQAGDENPAASKISGRLIASQELQAEGLRPTEAAPSQPTAPRRYLPPRTSLSMNCWPRSTPPMQGSLRPSPTKRRRSRLTPRQPPSGRFCLPERSGAGSGPRRQYPVQPSRPFLARGGLCAEISSLRRFRRASLRRQKSRSWRQVGPFACPRALGPAIRGSAALSVGPGRITVSHFRGSGRSLFAK